MYGRSICLLVLVALTTSTLIAQRDAARQIPRSSRTHLRDAVQPDDKFIVVIETNPPPLTMSLPDDVNLTKWFSTRRNGPRQNRATSGSVDICRRLGAIGYHGTSD